MQFSFGSLRPIFFGLLLIALFAGGCVRTTQPILKDEQVISNDALLGKWISKDGKVTAELRPDDDGEGKTAGPRIEPNSAEPSPPRGNKYKLTYTNEDGKTGHFIVRFGMIGDVSVAEMSADAFTDDMNSEYKSLLMPMYTMVVIQKTQPQLQLTGISIDWFKKYVKAHPDELDVNNPDDLVTQASTDDFQKFFTKHYKDDGMLGDPAVFVHPGDPTTQPAAAK